MEEKTLTEESLEKVIREVEEDYEMPSKDGLIRALQTSLKEAQKLKQYEVLLENFSQVLKNLHGRMTEVMELDDADEQGTGDLWFRYAQNWQNNGIEPELSQWFSDAFGNNTSARGGGLKL